MTLKPLVGVALIVLGALSLAWPKLTYTKETHDAKLGPLEFQVKEKDTLHIPMWVGLVAIAGGAALMIRRKG